MEKKVTEKEIESKLVKGVKKLGGTAYKFVSPGNAGVPDRIVTLPGGKVIFVELKKPGGKTTPLQDVQLSRLRMRGCDAGIVGSLEELERFMEYCERRVRRYKLIESASIECGPIEKKKLNDWRE